MSERSIKRSHARRIRRAAAAAATTAAATAAVATPASAATLQVTNNLDSGPDSLRAQIVTANGTAAEDTITFAPSVTGQINLAATLPVTEPLRIQGPGAASLAIDGGDAVQLFDVGPSSPVSGQRNLFAVSGLTLTGGYSSTYGGAMYASYADVQISDAVITGNKSLNAGGAIYADSVQLEITNSQVTDNTSLTGDAGAIYLDGDNDYAPTDDAEITGSRFIGNKSNGEAGAIYVDSQTGGDVTISRSTLADNEAVGQGGAAYFVGHQGKTTISQSTISGNTASDGGGIFFNSLFHVSDRSLLIENSTITGNIAAEEGGGLYDRNGVSVPAAIRNSTIAGNIAGAKGGGIYRIQGDLTMSSTIVAANTAAPPADADLAQGIAASGSFIAGDGIVGAAGSATLSVVPAGSMQIGVDPQLGPLADNGGPTLTMLPAAAGPAIDKGAANGLTEDQRGLPRTSGGGTDVGAVELPSSQPPTPPDTEVTGARVTGKPKQKQKGKKVVIKVAAGADETVDLAATGQIKVKRKTFTLKRVTKVDVPGDSTANLKLKAKKKKDNAKILAGKKKARVTVTVEFTDESGNSATKSLKLRLK